MRSRFSRLAFVWSLGLGAFLFALGRNWLSPPQPSRAPLPSTIRRPVNHRIYRRLPCFHDHQSKMLIVAFTPMLGEAGVSVVVLLTPL